MTAFFRLGISMKRVADALHESNHPGTGFDNPCEKALFDAAIESGQLNQWFTRPEVTRALYAIAGMLNKKNLVVWLKAYPGIPKGYNSQKKVAVIMAGNIPLVGFHDFLCVLVSGHRFAGKLSSQDALLPVAVAKLLVSYDTAFNDRIEFSFDVPPDADAVIATGSDNTARYFGYHFGNKPHLIRKNRNSAAVLTGNETDEELEKLGEDVFAYFGLGCRSVSHLIIPAGFEISRFEKAWAKFNHIVKNKKYSNNLLHERAILTATDKAFTDLGHCLLVKDTSLASPVAVLNYTSYDSISEATAFIKQSHDALQCVVCARHIDTSPVPLVRPGESQYPGLADYADGVDTMSFLGKLP